MPIRLIKVRANVPKECSDEEIAAFVTDALGTWGGQFDPDDPLFDSLDVRSVTIRNRKYKTEN